MISSQSCGDCRYWNRLQEGSHRGVCTRLFETRTPIRPFWADGLTIVTLDVDGERCSAHRRAPDDAS